MDCPENLNPCFLTFLKSDTALLIRWRKAMNHSSENLQKHSFKTSQVIWGQEDHSFLWVPRWPLVLLRERRGGRNMRGHLGRCREDLVSSFGCLYFICIFFSMNAFVAFALQSKIVFWVFFPPCMPEHRAWQLVLFSKHLSVDLSIFKKEQLLSQCVCPL